MKFFLRPYKINKGIETRRLSRAGAWIAIAALSTSMVSRPVARQAEAMQLAALMEHPSFLLLHSHSQSYLGVDIVDVDQERARALHLKDAHGAEITVLDHDAPAGKVGLKLHDVVLQMNGVSILGEEQMKQLLHQTAIVHKVVLVVIRDGEQITVTT